MNFSKNINAFKWPFLLSRPTALLLTVVLLSACASTAKTESAYNLGVEAYRAKDYVAAREYWARAIDDGQLYAYNNLGYLLFQGLGGPSDSSEAVKLWLKGAVAGHSEAQWHLGQAYEEGKGVEKSHVEAYAWYRCAIASAEMAAREDETEGVIANDARKSLAALLPRLGASEFPASELLAKQYIARYLQKPGV